MPMPRIQRQADRVVSKLRKFEGKNAIRVARHFEKGTKLPRPTLWPNARNGHDHCTEREAHMDSEFH